jgi:hypothetical protein
MSCSCKGNTSNKQVTAVKQVVKSTPATKYSSSLPKKNITKKVTIRRPI